MWYKAASVSQTVEKIADELIRARIKKAYVAKTYRFPTKYESDIAMKKVKYKIKMHYGSVYSMRKDLMERKISKLVDQILDDMNIV